MLIAHITDSHIVEKDQHWLSQPSTETHSRLSKAVAYLNNLHPRPDLVLLTGDLTDRGSQASYHHFQQLVSQLNLPLFVIPGNHDCRELMREAFSECGYMPKTGFLHYTLDDYPIRLIGLDTLEEGKDYGCICEERFQWLANTLKEDGTKPTLIFMHHPPIKIGMHLFDTIRCMTPSNFETLICEAKNLIGIVTGHYHHLCVGSLAGKSCFLAPSLAPVHHFSHPHDEDVCALELSEPAITLHQWHGGLNMTSHVVRLKEDYKRIDWACIKKTLQ